MAGKKQDRMFVAVILGFSALAFWSKFSRPIVPFGDPKINILRAQQGRYYTVTYKDGTVKKLWSTDLADAFERGEKIAKYEELKTK